MPRIPLIEDLTTGPIPPGSNFLVEYDPSSQWYNASVTMGAGWIKTGGKLGYGAYAQSPSNVRTQLDRVGLNTKDLEENDKLRIFDYYTLTLGLASKERIAANSLKVSELSINISKGMKEDRLWQDAYVLRIPDSFSVLARFNDEKSWVEYLLTRFLASSAMWKCTTIVGVMRGVHSEWAYKQLEGAVEGVIDFKLEETGEGRRDVMAIRTARNVGFDRRWHQLKIGENFEVTLEN